jgi:peptide deformylase
MAILPIITAPSMKLKATSEAVETVDDGIRKLLEDMLETMYAAPGIGLAAIQVGVPKRAIVVDLGRDAQPDGPLFLVNPKIVWTSDEFLVREEGCLSLPEQYADVVRPSEVKISYVDYDNIKREINVDEILSTCIQHEMDHLEGILFVDHLSAVKRSMIVRRLAKARKQAQYATV